MDKERRKTNWLPYIAQAIILLGAAWGYALTQESRMTTLEVLVSQQAQMLQRHQEQLEMMQLTLTRLVALEEFVHSRGGP